MVEAPQHRPTIYLTLADHGHSKESARTATTHYNEVKRFLRPRKNRKKRAMVCIEEASRFTEERDMLRTWVKHGLAYSEYLTHQYLARHNIELPDSTRKMRRFIRKAKKELKSTNLTQHAEIKSLDKLIRRFKGRIDLVSESIDYSEAQTSSSYAIKTETEIAGAYEENDFQKALISYRTTVLGLAANLSERDTRSAKSVSEDVQKSNPDRVYIKRGTAHTLLARLLSKKGYDVKINFSEKNSSVLYFRPQTQATRWHAFFPNREWSDLEWSKSLIGEIISNVLIVRGDDHQLAAKKAFKIMKSLDAEKVEMFIKYFGETREFEDLLVNLINSEGN